MLNVHRSSITSMLACCCASWQKLQNRFTVSTMSPASTAYCLLCRANNPHMSIDVSGKYVTSSSLHFTRLIISASFFIIDIMLCRFIVLLVL